jgi:1,4-dihydroxy-2-naphthoate octaprenyltransferase
VDSFAFNMSIVGYVCIIVAVIWIVLKIRLSYMSFGGTVMVTVYDAAIFPPFIGVFGLYWVAGSFGIDYSIWAYVGLAFAVAVLVIVAIRVAEELGDRRRDLD